MPQILIVDDEEDIRDLLRYNLEKEGHSVEEAANGEEALAKARAKVPDLILLDVMMPVLDGMETCARMREDDQLKNVIITFLSARGEDYSQIAGLDVGADDFITKPIRPRLLVSKINSLLRRGRVSAEQDNSIEIGGVSLDLERYQVKKDGQEVYLPKKEFEILSLLMSRAGHVLTRVQILTSIWGDGVVVGDRTVDVHIRKLREKIGEGNIETIKGIGYRFKGS